jgi:U3 small nucleolar ribonucleoprotein protein IMP4
MALRRNARLRREYLYKKSLEGKAKEEYDRKERLRAAIQGKYR